MRKALIVLLFQTFFEQSSVPNPFNPSSITPQIKQVSGTYGYYLIDNHQPLVVASPTNLFALADSKVGQVAFDACTKGTIPPLTGPVGIGTSCENNRQEAIRKDIDNRVDIAVQSIPSSMLVAQKLYLFAPPPK